MSAASSWGSTTSPRAIANTTVAQQKGLREMGREIRRVPANWVHPKYGDADAEYKRGRFRPMFQWDFQESWREWKSDLRRWFRDYELWSKGLPGSLHTAEDIATHVHFDTYYGEPPTPPNPLFYMPSGDWYQLFETVSEGTPQSPPFETVEELIEHLVSVGDFRGNKWQRESAESIARLGWAPTLLASSAVIQEPHEMS